MTRLRVHIFLPDTEKIPGNVDDNRERLAELEATFDELFGLVETAAIQDRSGEWVSEVFEETDANLERIDTFEQECLSLFPDADVLQTRQDRDVMDGKADEFEYDEAIMLQFTYGLS